MLIKKILQTKMDLIDMNDIFCSNYKKMMLGKLNKLYKNKCYNSILIVEISKLINFGDLTCMNKTLDGFITLDVIFEVIGIIYEENEIIHGCKIVEINDNNKILARSENASILINNNTKLNIFKIDNIIPVIVKMTRYNIYADEISVSAIPLQPVFKKIYFYKVESNDEVDMDMLKALCQEITELENILEQVKSKENKIYKFFVNMLYPFKAYKDFSKIKDVETMPINEANIEKFKSKKNLVLFRPDLLLDDNNIYITDVKNLANLGKGILINMPIQSILLDLFADYKKNILSLNGFINNIDETKNNQLLWKLYGELKK